MASSIWSAPPAYYEPCYCDMCVGQDKLRGWPCWRCGEKLFGCRELTCPTCNEFPIVRQLELSDMVFMCWATPRVSAGHDEFCGGRRDTATELCVCQQLRKIRTLRRPHIMATRIQSLWRGFKVRKRR